MEPTGRLILIPNLLGPDSKELTIPPGVSNTINQLRHFIVENNKTARRHLRTIGFESSFDDVELYSIGKHSDLSEYPTYLDPAIQGEDIGLFSEAGMPGIADPGAEIVQLAHDKGIRVTPLTGPSSILMALICSGMNGQQFSFHGYLPKDKRARIKKLLQLEKSVRSFGSQIFMETPYRNNQLLQDILDNCLNSSKLCVAYDITLASEFIKTKTISEWKQNPPDLNKRPAVFIIGN